MRRCRSGRRRGRSSSAPRATSPAAVRLGQEEAPANILPKSLAPSPEPQIAAVRAGRLGENNDGTPLCLPPQVCEGRVQPLRADGPRRAEVVGRPRRPARTRRAGRGRRCGARSGRERSGARRRPCAVPRRGVRVLTDSVRGVAAVPRGDATVMPWRSVCVLRPRHQVEGVPGSRPERALASTTRPPLARRPPSPPAQQSVDAGFGVFGLVGTGSCSSPPCSLVAGPRSGWATGGGAVRGRPLLDRRRRNRRRSGARRRKYGEGAAASHGRRGSADHRSA